jgi:hypothetical protein
MITGRNYFESMKITDGNLRGSDMIIAGGYRENLAIRLCHYCHRKHMLPQLQPGKTTRKILFGFAITLSWIA